MSRKLKISVVIATFNRRQLLARTLPTLFDQDLPPDDYEVIVVVDGSTDRTIDVLRSFKPQCKLTIVEQANRGQALACNTGFEVAQGELVLVLDDDILCPRSLLSEHVAAHEGLEKSLVSGPVFVAPETPANTVTDWLRVGETTYNSTNGSHTERQWPNDTKVDANTSIARSVLLECGGFAAEFTRARCDVELGLRLHRMGFNFVFRLSAFAHQIYTKSFSSLIDGDAGAYGVNELKLCRMYPEYRSVSCLARLNEGGLLKRTVRRAVARSQTTRGLIRAAFSILQPFRGLHVIGRASLRLFQALYTSSLLRSGVEAAGSWNNFFREYGLQLPVLLYHHVGPNRDGTFQSLTVSPEKFEAQIKWLARRGYKGVTASDWLRWCATGKVSAKKPVLLTFDDGYKDLAQYAFPILEQHGFGAAVYIVTSQVGGTNLWDQQSGSAPHDLLNADDIQSWSKRGIEFGSHSCTHPDLTTLRAEDLNTEILGSKELLASILSTQVSSFAYPYGGHDARVTQQARDAYQTAVTTEVGMNHLGSDLLSIKRSMVKPGDTLLDFRLRVKLGWNPIEGARIRIARLRGRIPAPAGNN